MSTLLAMDLGGITSAVGLYELSYTTVEPLWSENYRSSDFESVDEIINLFLEEGGLQPEFVCVAVSGIVTHGVSKTNSLSWQIAETSLLEKFAFTDVRLINNMTAFCSAIPTLSEDESLVLQAGAVDPRGAAAVLAPGTCLGEGVLWQNGNELYPLGTEGGHALFSPVDELQLALLEWLKKQHEVVTAEMVCSGTAVYTIYQFLIAQGEKETEDVASELGRVSDPSQVIVDNAIGDSGCPLCRNTMELFLALLGTEAANVALKLYSTRGLYLGGGMLTKLVDRFPFTSFLHAFVNMGERKELMSSIPVRLILKEDTVLDGIVRYSNIAFDQ